MVDCPFMKKGTLPIAIIMIANALFFAFTIYLLIQKYE